MGVSSFGAPRQMVGVLLVSITIEPRRVASKNRTHVAKPFFAIWQVGGCLALVKPY